MSDSVRPHRQQPTSLAHPWDFPGKNTGVGCHFLLQCMKVKSGSEVDQSCPTLCDPMDCNPPGFSVDRIFQARVLEWGATAFSEKDYRYIKNKWIEKKINMPILILRKVQWRRKWQPAPVFLPGESQGQGGLVGCRLWGRTVSDTTEAI